MLVVITILLDKEKSIKQHIKDCGCVHPSLVMRKREGEYCKLV